MAIYQTTMYVCDVCNRIETISEEVIIYKDYLVGMHTGETSWYTVSSYNVVDNKSILMCSTCHNK